MPLWFCTWGRWNTNTWGYTSSSSLEVTEDLASEDIAVDQQPGDVDVSRPLVSVAVEDCGST
eukprot:3531407-Amphidinium_carterae.1